VESSGGERLMMDGKAGKAVRSKIHSPEAHGINSAVWVRERAGHEGQGSSPGLEHPVNLSQVLTPAVRFCRIKTTPHVERKDLLGTRPQGCQSFQVQSEAAWLKMDSGLYRRGQAMGEGESLWSTIICNHQMEQVDMPD
jgi:hypothetical protein